MFIQPRWNKYIHKQKGMLHKYLLLQYAHLESDVLDFRKISVLTISLFITNKIHDEREHYC